MAPGHLLLCCILSIINFANCRVLNQIGRLYIPHTDIPGSENSAIDYDNERIFVADGYDKSVNSIDFSLEVDDDNVTYAQMNASVNIFIEPAFKELGMDPINVTDITCVAMNYEKKYVVTTIVPVNHSVNNGWLGFVDPSNQSVFHLMELEDCFLPDHVAVTYSGDIILVSCEAEPSDNEDEDPTYDPAGSVGYIDVSSDNISDWEYANIGFTDFDIDGKYHDLLPEDIYYPHEASAFSVNAEPEHIVVDTNDTYAYVGLQESNAVAVLDIEGKEIINVFSFGYGYFGSNGGLDPSDDDDGINIAEYPNLWSMRQPDDIDFFMTSSGRKFIFTANEGDSKKFDATKVKHLELDEEAFGGANMTDYLKMDEILGGLKVSNLLGLTVDDTYDDLYMFSSRDFTVFEVCTDADGVPNNISLHFSSDNDFENITATMIPEGFNSDYTGNSFDSRSDAKGPEPEGLTIGECENGRRFVFICMERVGGIFAYDFTDIDNITFADYINNRNFSTTYDDEDSRPPENAGDIGPEQLRWIPAGSVTNQDEPLLVVSNPQSASVTMYRIDCGDDPTIPTESMGVCPIYTTSTTSEGGNSGDTKEETLTTLEIVAIAVGSFAVLSIIVLVTYMMCKKKKNGIEDYKYNSLNEFGNSGGNFSDNRGASGHYFELEK